jgi:pyruvate/2-oxoglutarate dehydrogenase complex dihydrolipoamide acyltransferase (E2) component
VVGEQTTDEAAITAKEQERASKHKHATVDLFAAQRAVNAKDYLVTEQGIDASRISVATGPRPTVGQTEENYLVPSGATIHKRCDRDDAGGRDCGEAAGAQAAAAKARSFSFTTIQGVRATQLGSCRDWAGWASIFSLLFPVF